MTGITKTSLSIIALIFTGGGAAILLDNPIVGSIFLILAMGTLVLQGWLEQKGIVVKKSK